MFIFNIYIYNTVYSMHLPIHHVIKWTEKMILPVNTLVGAWREEAFLLFVSHSHPRVTAKHRKPSL